MDNYALYEKIENYLKGILSLEETKKFEQDIAKNPSLAEMVQMHRLEWDAMEVIIENDLRGKMTAWDKQAPPSVKTTEKSPFLSVFKNRRFYHGLAVAASVTLLMASVIWLFKEKEKTNTAIVKTDTPTENTLPQDTATHTPPQDFFPQQNPSQLEPQQKKENTKIVQTPKKQVEKSTQSPSSQNVTPEIAPSLVNEQAYIAIAETAYNENDVLNYAEVRGTRGNSTEENILDEAGKAYDKHEFSKAISLLQDTPVKDENFVALEILGHAYFKSKQYKAALPIFQNLLKLSGKRSHDKSEWYLLLCYLANYSQYKAEFETLAQKITIQNEQDYREQTLNLLNIINKK